MQDWRRQDDSELPRAGRAECGGEHGGRPCHRAGHCGRLCECPGHRRPRQAGDEGVPGRSSLARRPGQSYSPLLNDPMVC